MSAVDAPRPDGRPAVTGVEEAGAHEEYEDEGGDCDDGVFDEGNPPVIAACGDGAVGDVSDSCTEKPAESDYDERHVSTGEANCWRKP